MIEKKEGSTIKLNRASAINANMGIMICRPNKFFTLLCVACVAAILCGAFNGVLVAYFKIQPMVATLILFTAGRSIAAWINNNELPIISDPVFGYFGNFFPALSAHLIRPV